MDWKGLAIGMGNAVGTALPAMERMDMAEEELGMRKDTHNIQMEKYKEEQDIKNGLERIALESLNETKAITPATPQGAIGGGAKPVTANPVPTPTPQVNNTTVLPDQPNTEATVSGAPTVTVSGAPNVDSGSAIEVGQKPGPIMATEYINKQQQAVSSAAAPTPAPQAATTPQPAEGNLPILNIRSNMLMKMHDFLMSKGRITEAKQLRKAEIDNIVNIAKISPNAAVQGWNKTPWLVEEYGPLTPKDIKGEGKNHVLTFGPNHDGIIQWDEAGAISIIKPSSGKTEKLSQAGSTPDGRPVSYDSTSGGYFVDGKPYAGRVLPKVEKIVKEGGGDKLTMTDVKSGFTMRMTDIKNRMLVDMTPDERQDFANMPAENLMAALLGGSGKSLSPDKKEAYKKEIAEVSNYYGTLEQQVLGRKGVTAPKAPAPQAAIGGGAVAPAKKANSEYLLKYFKDNASKSDSKKVYDTLRQAGYSDEAIKEAWKQYRAANQQ